jgi:pimeloyl-ACP methyl ester carboxylesterase
MRPTVILPGYLAAASEYGELVENLTALTDSKITIVPLKRQDWLVTLGGRPVTPILHALDQTIQSVLAEGEFDQVNLVGHSAGGWISRIYLGSEPYCSNCWYGLPHVSTLITLGTPHLSQERWTKRNLDFVNDTYPGAFYDRVNYVCVVGRSRFGQKSWKLGERFTYQSYKLTCGAGDRWGDGVTPIEAAHLDGAENLTVEEVWHSPNSKQKLNPSHRWYGSKSVVETWMPFLG